MRELRPWPMRLRHLVGWYKVGDLFCTTGTGTWWKITGIDHCYGWHPNERYTPPEDEALAEGARLIAEIDRKTP